MTNTLQIKRGQKTNIPVLSTGEYGYTEDTQEVFIGTGSSNIRVLTEDDLYTDSDVNSHLSGGTGIDYSSGTISTDDANIDHGSLQGINDDDHSQYHNDTRGDTRYLYKENTDPFTPDADYEPATKKYVDDNAGGNVSTSGTPVDNDFAKFTDGSTIEGRSYSEVRSDLNVEDGADVTDTSNVTSAGALMDSECTSLANVKALDQDVTSGSSPTFNADNLSDGGSNAIVTTTQETNWDNHLSDNGADHSYIDQDVTSGSSPTFNADNLSDGGSNVIVTTTQETNWDSHLNDNGADHGYIDQDVTSGSSPILDGTNITGIPSSGLNAGVGISDNNIVEIDDADAADNDYAKFTANGLEGRSYSEVRSDINVEDGADVTDTANVTNAGALMDSECTSLTDVKALDQSVISGASPTFDGTNFTGIDANDVDIADAGSLITATDVEAALQENRAAIDLNTNDKADLASPILTGTPAAPTAGSNTNTTQIATTAFVQTELTDLIGGAPGALDTLNELAAAINDDSSYASTVTSALGNKVSTSSDQALSSDANAMTIAGHTITLNRGDGTTDTVVVPDNNTTYSVGDGGLTQKNFTTALKNKLDGIDSSANDYTHPSYDGDDFGVDTGVLSGATVVSDIDINVTTDGSGHVTDANGSVSTRNLTKSDIGLGSVPNTDIAYSSTIGLTDLDDYSYNDLTSKPSIAYASTIGLSDLDDLDAGGKITNVTDPTSNQEAATKKYVDDNDSDTTYSSSDFTHDDLSGFVSNEHIDWTSDQGATNIHTGNYTDTTYSVQDGGLTQKNFTTADNTKLDGIESSADVTDTSNVTSAGALMDSEVTNLTQVKAFASSDYATSAQGSTADSAMQDLSDDTTPQLGGDLENNGHLIKNAITLNANSIDVAYTIPTGYNGMSVGPLDIDANITIESGSVWEISGHNYTDVSVVQLTSTDTSTDINQASWTSIQWDTWLLNDNNISKPSATEIQVGNSGTYRIYAHLSYDVIDARSNPGVAIAINGVLRSARGLSGYCRVSDGHNEASNFVEEIISLSVNDKIQIQTYQYASSGTCTLRSNESVLIIQRLK